MSRHLRHHVEPVDPLDCRQTVTLVDGGPRGRGTSHRRAHQQLVRESPADLSHICVASHRPYASLFREEFEQCGIRQHHDRFS
jgi:hypothetical protein